MAMCSSSLIDRVRALCGLGCPGETDLAAFVDGAFREESRRHRIEHHLAVCGACRSQVGFLVRMQRPDAETQPPSEWIAQVDSIARTRARSSQGWRWTAAAVAVTALIAMAALLLVRKPHPTQPSLSRAGEGEVVAHPPVVATYRPESPPQPLRRPGSEVVRRPAGSLSIAVLSPAEGSRVSAGSAIQWKPVEGALYYHLKLLSADGGLLREQKAEGPAGSIPADLAIPAGSKFFLVIHAYLPNGKTVASPVVSLKLFPGR